MVFEAFIAHLVGDYVIQSDWMAMEKTKRWWPAVAHGLTYALPFLIVTRSPWALLIIAGTHIVIDRFRLARHVCWAKNWLAPRGWNRPWRECLATGYTPAKPVGFAVALMIVADNTMHIAINTAALIWLG